MLLHLAPKKTKKQSLMTIQTFINRCMILLLFVSVFAAAWMIRNIDQNTLEFDTMDMELFENKMKEPSPGKEADSLAFLRPLLRDLQKRKRMFEAGATLHYWSEFFEDSEKYHYRFSRALRETEYFIGRDDSGVVSSRFITETGGNKEFRDFYKDLENAPAAEKSQRLRLWKNCKALGHAYRSNSMLKDGNDMDERDPCRVLFVMNTVGAKHGVSLLWETQPPALDGTPRQWMSEHESALMHLERNLQEINSLCMTGFIAARMQILVCEPIADEWTKWMEAQVVDCEGQPWSQDTAVDRMDELENGARPIQVVVAAVPSTVDTCNDQNSGFMEKAVRLLAFEASPEDTFDESHDGPNRRDRSENNNSDVFDLFVSLKWSSLVTIRAVQSFVQASADLEAAAAYSEATGSTVLGPSSGFLIPSFVRVSYVSEQDTNVAKWRMHGDFFHPAAWEINSKSFDVTWMPGSLAGEHVFDPMCNASVSTLAAEHFGQECGQHWVYLTENQMPSIDEVYVDEIAPPPILGGSNHFWMLTARQRIKIIEGHSCRENKYEDCHDPALAVIPLGDLESFQINYALNKALDRRHAKDRAPGYSDKAPTDDDLIREQLKGKEDIERAFFDYNIYSSALFRKDATLKAVRARDRALSMKEEDPGAFDPPTIKSEYYDATITQPRGPILGWCQRIARRGLCSLYSDYFRTSSDSICSEACGLKRDFSQT